jgi:hypothetical protein
MQTKRRLAAAVAGCLAATAALLGCELIVDFDRSKIPQGPGDAMTIEGGVSDGGDAQAVTDAPAPDADATSTSQDASDGSVTVTGDASDGATDASEDVAADADDSG